MRSPWHTSPASGSLSRQGTGASFKAGRGCKTHRGDVAMRATTGFSLSFAVSLTTLLAACGGGGGGYGGGGGGNPADPSGAYYGSGVYADEAGNDTLMLV